MAGIITSSNTALPRDIDVKINVSKPQSESTTDLSLLCFLTFEEPKNPLEMSHDSTRIKFYRSLNAVAEDFIVSSEVYKAATAFFSQTPRAAKMGVARIFNTPQKGYLQCGVLASKTLAQWQSITDGSFKITIDGVTNTVSNVSFASITAIEGIATAIQTAIQNADSSDSFVNASVVYSETGLRIFSGTTGDASSVGYLQSATSGTDLSGSTGINGAYIEGSEVQQAYIVPGYSPLVNGVWDIKSEMNYVQQSAGANGSFVYAWTFEKSLRDNDNSLDAAEYVEAQTYGICGLVSNIPTAKSSASTTDIGAIVEKRGYRRTFVVYHDNAYFYPEVSILSYALSVNYALENSTITTKFKKLQGIPTVPITESELEVLNSKRINTYTLVGNDARTFREGVDADSSWYIDDLINLDNFREELQVSVYNVFLQNKKVPYNVNGVTMLYSAMQIICDRYVRNGTFTERPLSEAEAREKGGKVAPAYTITFTPIGEMTLAERTKRVGPPCKIVVNLAGAIHSISIDVEAYS